MCTLNHVVSYEFFSLRKLGGIGEGSREKGRGFVHICITFGFSCLLFKCTIFTGNSFSFPYNESHFLLLSCGYFQFCLEKHTKQIIHTFSSIFLKNDLSQH